MYTDRFIHFLRFEKRYSPNTITAYEKDLDQFQTFLKTEYQTDRITDVNFQMIRSWIVNLSNDQIGNRSINRKLSTLKTYFRYLIKENLISDNPLIKVIPPKTNKRLPEFVREETMNELLDDIDFGEGFPGIRDRLIIELFYFTGVRLSELVNIKNQDIDLTKMQISVIGKRNKQRIIPITNPLTGSINKYKAAKEEFTENHEPNGYFFVTNKGKRIYKEFVYRCINSYLGMVSTLRKKSPHILRHTFATHMLNNGADLNAIKELLGHSSLSATQVYTHNTIEKLKSIYKLAHPRA
ncbi:MAG: integrase [Bacteroidetes bacterium]|nr:integrase [Bacteroidota bacterium]